MDHLKQLAVLTGVYVAVSYAITQAIKKNWDSNQAADDNGVTSYRVNKGEESESTSPKTRRPRSNSQPAAAQNAGNDSAPESGYHSAIDEGPSDVFGRDEDDPPADVETFEEQLAKLWAGPLPDELQDILDILRFPDIAATFQSTMPRGILLTGPPGTGKTWFAKCLAQVTHASFFYASASQFDEIYVGRGPQRIRALFAEAAAANKANQLKLKQKAADADQSETKSPIWWRRVLFGSPAAATSTDQLHDNSEKLGQAMSIIFIDEIDALGSRGGMMSGDARHATLSELLTQMDGMHSDACGTILVVAATNNMELLDSALSRSGRFDRIVQMSLPQLESRLAIIRHYLMDKPLSPQATEALPILGKATEGFNCADLKNMVNEATLAATRAAIAIRKRADRRNRKSAAPPSAISSNDLIAAFESLYNKVRRERPQNELLSRRQVNELLAPLRTPQPADEPD